MIAILTFAFVALYAAALGGWLKPLENTQLIARLEPIIFVIIGYYFGRLPAAQNEKTLQTEIARQIQRADAAQHAKEQAQQTRENLEEKIKNARRVLDYGQPPHKSDLTTDAHRENGGSTSNLLTQAAIKILDS